MTRGHAILLRDLIRRLSTGLTDNEAVDAIELLPTFELNHEYHLNDRFKYNIDGEYVPFKVVQPVIVSSELYLPGAIGTESIYAKILYIDGSAPQPWVQPDSTNPYNAGDKVTHKGHTWSSTIGSNVWEPGVYGWEIVE